MRDSGPPNFEIMMAFMVYCSLQTVVMEIKSGVSRSEVVWKCVVLRMLKLEIYGWLATYLCNGGGGCFT